MSSIDFSDALWRKSSYSNGQANCVEAATIERGGRVVAVRDSKAPADPPSSSGHRRGGSSLRA